MIEEIAFWAPQHAQELVEIFVNNSSTEQSYRPYLQNTVPRHTGMAVAFPVAEGASASRGYPCLLLVSEEKISDIFSWAHTYSQKIFPFSQFCRIMTFDDFDRLSRSSDKMAISTISSISQSWASVVLGEFLSQTEGQFDLPGIPYASVNSCYSQVMANIASTFESESLFDLAGKRLLQIEIQQKLGMRPVSINVLNGVWTLLLRLQGSRFNMTNIASVTEGNLSSVHMEPLFKEDVNISMLIRSKFQDLFSDSIEARVVAHAQLCRHAHLETDSSLDITTAAQLIALGVILVGRGTSHHFMLKEQSKKYPGAYIWFSLFAGLLGPNYWDESWSVSVRGIQKYGHTSPHILSHISADICWREYDWMSKTFTGIREFLSIQRQSPRLLNIEIFPGSVFQLRLSDGNAGNAPLSRESNENRDDKQNEDVRKVLEGFIDLADQARYMLKRSSTGHPRGHSRPLLKDPSTEDVEKRSYPSRSKGKSSRLT